MCDISAFMMENGREVKLLENVDLVEAENGAIRLLNIFGEEKRFAGRLLAFNNSEKKMVFAAAPV